MLSTYETLLTSPDATNLLEEMSRQHLAFLASTKTCRVCEENKPRSEFPKHSHSHDGCDSRCRDCKSKQRRLREAFKKEYPVPSPGDCPLCRKYTERWVLDHCHETDSMRGYICNDCNVGLGHFDDNAEFLERAAAWVKGSMPSNNLPRHLL